MKEKSVKWRLEVGSWNIEKGDLIFSSCLFVTQKIKDAPHLAHLSFEDHLEFHKIIIIIIIIIILIIILIQNVFPTLP